MIGSLWPEGNGKDSPLPAPNVVVAKSGTPLDELSPEAIKSRGGRCSWLDEKPMACSKVVRWSASGLRLWAARASSSFAYA